MMVKKTNKKHKIIFFIVVILILFLAFFYTNQVLTKTFSLKYDAAQYQQEISNFVEEILPEIKEETKPKIIYIETPTSTKAIYMTACVASTIDFKQDLVDLIEQTELNSIIIDIKDFTGTISFDTGLNLEGENGAGCRAKNLPDFIKTLKEKGIYTIARITVFQDPFYAKLHPELAVKKKSDGTIWMDHKGLNFIDVGAKKYWDYILEIAKASHQIGFDEINFDYIRFPSDGNMNDIYFSHVADILEKNREAGLGKQIVLEEFFKYLKNEIDKYNLEVEKKGLQKMITSADLFGMVTTNYDDLGIGQVLEKTLPYFDYIAPMVYPSHYPNGFNGWSNPNHVPYELIHFVMKSAVDRVEIMKNATSTPEHVRDFISSDQLRPWLQDFDYGGDYGPKEVRAQIQATYDSGLDSWMLWAPSNRYTKEALKKE
jgi:hypothetical protein